MPQRRSHFPIPASESSIASSKRAHSPEQHSSKSTPARQSKRLKSSPITKTTPKKSPYFEHPTSESEATESEVEKEESGYEDEDASVVSSPPSSDAEDGDESEEYNSDDDEKTKKKQKNKVRRNPGTKMIKVNGSTPAVPDAKGNELWRPGVKSHLAPGEAVFIKLPKARAAGSTPYTPSTIHPNTLLFLGELKQNNDREWLKVHDADYRASQADWNSFVESLSEKISEKDETIPELPPKDLTFRIYRDVRFSPDPTPYKTHFSAAWSRTGRKGPYAGYYLQIQPKGSFVGAGVWHPEAPPLALLRQAVDRRSQRLKEVLMAEGMRREFLGGIKSDEAKCVAKFVDINKESALKTKPKGFDADNPNIALLRLRNYTIGRKLKDEEVLGKGALARITELIGVLEPFVSYLNSVVMPDEEPSDDDDDDEEAEEGDEDDNNEDGEEEQDDEEEDDDDDEPQ